MPMMHDRMYACAETVCAQRQRQRVPRVVCHVVDTHAQCGSRAMMVDVRCGVCARSRLAQVERCRSARPESWQALRALWSETARARGAARGPWSERVENQ